MTPCAESWRCGQPPAQPQCASPPLPPAHMCCRAVSCSWCCRYGPHKHLTRLLQRWCRQTDRQASSRHTGCRHHSRVWHCTCLAASAWACRRCCASAADAAAAAAAVQRFLAACIDSGGCTLAASSASCALGARVVMLMTLLTHQLAIQKLATVEDTTNVAHFFSTPGPRSQRLLLRRCAATVRCFLRPLLLVQRRQRCGAWVLLRQQPAGWGLKHRQHMQFGCRPWGVVSRGGPLAMAPRLTSPRRQT